jgi:hypothetical protein
MNYNSRHFCEDIIPDIQQNICSSGRRKTLNNILLHLASCILHLASCILTMQQLIICDVLQKALNPQKPKEAASTFWPSPDRPRSDFFLFSYLKEKLRGRSFPTSHDLIFAIRQILSEIPEMVLKNVFTN